MTNGILETFGILFDSDAEEVKKGAEEAENAADDLEDKLDDVGDSADALGDSFLDLIGNAKGAIAGLLSVGAIAGGIINAASMTDEVGKFSETLGLNIEEVSAWSEAVVRSGGDANGFRSSIKSLTDSMTDFALTGSGPAIDILSRLGIDAVDAGGKVRSAFELLPELADSFQSLSKAESVGFGQKLGLDQGTILLLQQGRIAVEDLVSRQRELGVATREDYEAAAQFNDQLADTKQSFNSLFISAGTTILPMFNSVLNGVTAVVDFFKENKTFATGFFVALGTAITVAYLPAITSAAVATLTAAAPFILIGALVTAAAAAFALLYDDIVNFIEGNDSFIGKIAKDYPLIGAIIERLVTNISNTFEALKWVRDFLIELFTEPQKALERLGALAQKVADSITKAFEGVKELIPEINLDDAVSGVSNFLGFGDDEISKNVALAGIQFDNIASNPLNAQTSNAIVNSSAATSNNTASLNVSNLNINTQATDAEGIAKGATDALNSQMQTLVNNFDDGVKA